MSVKGINLWIAFQLLKTNFQQFNTDVNNQLITLKQQMFNDVKKITEHLLQKINDQNQIIKQLQQKALQNRIDFFQFYEQNSEHNEKIITNLKAQLAEYTQKYLDLKSSNQSYEKQFVSLCSEIKQLRGCLNQLKNNQTFNQQSLNNSINQYFPEEIQTNYDKSLKKMNSQSNLQKRLIGQLDVIKQVTQISMISEQQVSQIQMKQISEIQPKIIDNSHSLISQDRYQSFQCTSSIHDVNRLIYEGFSRQTDNGEMCKNGRESLIAIKDYDNKRSNYQIPKFSCLLPYQLKLQRKIKQNYYKCNNGFVYTGNVIKFNKNDVPMGFGQLFYQNNLVYCGNWKNGMYSGYGKVIFCRQYPIKLYQGEILNGIPNGCGTIRFWNGDCFMGLFSNGEVKGMGTFYHNGQVIKEGIWRSNMLTQ